MESITPSPSIAPARGFARVCVARHGETAWNLEGILQGWSDVPLNELGREQSFAMARSFVGERFDAVWSSPLIRARECAEIIAGELQLAPPVIHTGLMERGFGVIQGVPKTELAELNPALLQQILRRNPAAEFDGGESIDEFADRVIDALEDIGAQSASKRVLVITHGWVMDVITRHIRGLPRDTILNMKRRNGESLWLEVSGLSVRELHRPEADPWN